MKEQLTIDTNELIAAIEKDLAGAPYTPPEAQPLARSAPDWLFYVLAFGIWFLCGLVAVALVRVVL